MQTPSIGRQRWNFIMITRRDLLQTVGAAGLASLAGASRAQSGPLKISHQFPGGTIEEGDFRDRLCRRFAADIEKRSNGALKAQVYPGSSLMKTNAQFSAMRKGALDISLYPLSYAGGEVPETNIGLMPALVPSYEVGAAWKTSDVGKLLAKTLDEKGIVVLSWIWQAGGVASRAAPLVQPEDAKGMPAGGTSRNSRSASSARGGSPLTARKYSGLPSKKRCSAGRSLSRRTRGSGRCDCGRSPAMLRVVRLRRSRAVAVALVLRRRRSVDARRPRPTRPPRAARCPAVRRADS